MTTPNEMDLKVANAAENLVHFDCNHEINVPILIAKYREEIEARKECELDNMHRAFNDAVEQRDANRRRISTLEAALIQAEPNIKCKYPLSRGWERVPCGKCISCMAIAAINSALHPTSPQPTSGDLTDSAAAK